MKRYWLFQYDNYYPSGGFNDFIGSYGTIEECKSAIQENWRVLGHIFDSQEQKIIESYYYEGELEEMNAKINGTFKPEDE